MIKVGGLYWGIFLAMVSFSVSACEGHECDASIVDLGSQAGEGHLLDPNTWESGPVDGDWIDYGHQRTLVFHLNGLEGRRLRIPLVSISPVKHGADDFTAASGNDGEIVFDENVSPPIMKVHNVTCSDYFMRVEVGSYPDDASISDGGGE